MLLLQKLHLFEGVIQLFLSIRTKLLLLVGQLFGFVGFASGFCFFNCYDTLLLLRFILVLREGLKELTHFVIFLL